MEKEKYIIEVDLQKYIKEQNKLYNINLNLFDLSKDKDNKINLINKNIALKDTNKIKKEILLGENTEYKFLLKIISRGNIDKIEQVIFNTKDEYDTEKIKIVKKKIQISQNPMANWRKENERTSIYNNGQLIFLKGLLQIIWHNCNEVITLENLKKVVKEYDPEYIEQAVKILVEKGVLVEYEK